MVDTSHLKSTEDIKCDDNGSWLNNGVRKLYLDIQNPDDPVKLKVLGDTAWWKGSSNGEVLVFDKDIFQA